MVVIFPILESGINVEDLFNPDESLPGSKPIPIINIIKDLVSYQDFVHH